MISIRDLLDLAKVRITFAVWLTSLAGYILAKDSLDWSCLGPTLGVFILGCGSGALNHFQERDHDALMERTKNRPIPSGRVSPRFALIIAMGFVLTGSLLLFLTASAEAMLWGLSALVAYNFFYTPLKRVSSFAVVPGGIIGSIPPVVGWVAAGGNPLDLEILTFALFIFIWQVPHFWLLAMFHGGDYAKAGFPTMTAMFSQEQMSRIIYSWILATAVCPFLMLVFGKITSLFTVILLCVLSFGLAWIQRPLLNVQTTPVNYKRSFMEINLYALAVMFILSMDKLLW